MTARQEPTERELLAQRLLQHLHPTDGRGVVDLLAIAGLPSGRGLAQSATIALNDLAAKGLARKEKGYGRIPLYFAVAAPVTAPEERVELGELDAVLVISAITARPVGAPSDRTTLTITATLGPSWPEGVRVPSWSTSLFAAQVAAGGLAGARSAGLARLTEMLTTLRYASPTHDFLPPPEVPVTDRDTISDLLAYCAGVSGGAKDSSVHSWLKARRVSRIRAEELLEQLVHEGRLRVVERPIAGGEVVVRYLPADPSTRPAPLPVSDAPAEEPVEEEPTPEEEPVSVAGAEEPCQGCAAPLTLSEAIAHAEEKGAGEGGCAADHRRLAGWLRELEESRKARAELGAGLEDALQRTADLAREVTTLRQERDAFRSELETATQNANRLRLEMRFAQAFNGELARALGVHPETHQRDLLARVAALLDEARAAVAAPTLDQGAIAHYLLSLPGDRWEALATARQQLAQAREMAHAARLLEEAALAAVDGLLSAPAGAPAPAPELVPDPIPLGPTPPPPPSGPQEPRSMREQALAYFQAHPTAELRAADLAEALDGDPHSWTACLSQLTTSGQIERVGRGVYRLARQARRAA